MKAIRVSEIDTKLLKKLNIKGIILDLDNTIVSEDDIYLSPEAEIWIQKVKSEGINFFILSNGKRKHRVDYWSSRLDIASISPAKKPLSKNFRKAIKHMKCLPHQVMVVGDSFHTDVVGAFLSGCSSIQVCSLPHPPRWWELIAGHWLQVPYRNIGELWQLNSKREYRQDL
jgi:hypothetical protein